MNGLKTVSDFATYYNLTVNGGSGSETGILKGSVRTLPTAPDAPEDGKYFIGWSDGSLIYAAGATIVVDREISVSPYYVDKDERFLAIFVDMDGVVYEIQTSDAAGYAAAFPANEDGLAAALSELETAIWDEFCKESIWDECIYDSQMPDEG